MKGKFILLYLAFFTYLPAQKIAFSDNFDSYNSEEYVEIGQIGDKNWTILRSGEDWGARIKDGKLELTNDVCPDAPNNQGWIFAYQKTQNFQYGFKNKLSQNGERITYFFNFKQSRPNPSGFSQNSYGVAFILGATDSNVAVSGSGYAVVLGNTSTPDVVRLVKFTNGIQTLGRNLSGIIISTLSFNNRANKYLSFAVTYEPEVGLWNLYGRIDGDSNFQNPMEGHLELIGSVVDAEFANLELNYMGAYWQGTDSENQIALFDNISVFLGDIHLPVELSSFVAVAYGNEVKLTWKTLSEINNIGWEIERRSLTRENSTANNWKSIAFVRGAGNSNSLKEYDFVDKLNSPGKYEYRLKQIDFDGKFEYSNIAVVDIKSLIHEINLAAYPNPFNPATTLRIEMPESAYAKLIIYDANGRLVAVLADGFFEAGIAEIAFNASSYSAGAYYALLKTDKLSVVRKLLLVK